MEKNYSVIFAAQKKVELLETPIKNPADDQVVIRTIVSQISTGTELTFLEGNVSPDSLWASRLRYPAGTGYANVGEIIEVGKDVSKDWLGKKVLTLTNHAKYTIANSKNLIEIPDSVNLDEAAFATLGQVAMGGIRAAEIKPGDVAVVFGAGLIGQLVARLAKIAGAITVFVADISDNRLNMLPKDKVFIPVNSGNVNIEEFIKEHNNGKRVNVAFETTGNPKLVPIEIGCIENSGRLVTVGSQKAPATIDFEYCNAMNIRIIPAMNFQVHDRVETPKTPWTTDNESRYFLELLSKDLISVKEMITHRANYKHSVAMYEMLMKDRSQALGVHLYWEEGKECLE